MKRHRLILSAALCGALLGACDSLPQPEMTPIEDRVPLKVNVTSIQTPTKGTIISTSMPDGSCLGVGVMESGKTTYDDRTYQNIPYQASSKDGVQEWNPVGEPIMLSTTSGTGYAYYPYSEDVVSLTEIPLIASSENQIDYLISNKLHGVRKNNASANVTMYHAISAVRLAVKRGTYAGTGLITAASIKGNNLAGSAMLNVTNGVLSSIDNVGLTIAPKIDPVIISSDVQWIDILAVPSGQSSTVDIELCIDGKITKVTTKAFSLSQGYLSRVNITIDKGSAYITSTDIDEWMHDKVSNRIDLQEHTITLGGTTEGLSFDSSVDKDGNVNIIVAPIHTRESEVKPVTFTGDATLTQSVNAQTGVMTITLSDIQSDVTINFNGIWLWLTLTFDVAEAKVGVQQNIFGTGLKAERVFMDGVEIDSDNKHTFETAGHHIMRVAPSTYKTIANSSFSNIAGLKSAIIPEGVEKLDAWVFIGTSSFQEVSLPSTLKSIGYQCFERTGLLSCVVPDGCSMGYGVFDECSKLTYAKLPSDMTAIPSNTFYACRALEKFDLPTAYTSIGDQAFYATPIKSFVLPKELTTIATSTFESCTALEEITLSQNLTSIKGRAFYSCKSLKKVILADGTYNEGEFTIPEGVTEIWDSALYTNSPYLLTIRVPSTLQTVKDRGLVSPLAEKFVLNKANPKFDIRNNSLVETATNLLVAGGIQSTKIHESVTSIGPYAFYSSKIEYVDLPSSITQIKDNAFTYSYPKQIISRAVTPPTLGTTPFQISQYNGTLKVPEAALEDYKNQWMINQTGYLGWSTARWKITALLEGE